MENSIRPSPIAGKWYSAEPGILAKELDGYIRNATLPHIPGTVVAVVSPHAGYQYSGSVAGHAFAAIRSLKPDVVAVISPMHRGYRQTFLTSGHNSYWTPFGEIEIYKPLVSMLTEALWNEYQLDLFPVRNDEEHSLEIELPFLQRIYTHHFTLVPVMVRDIQVESCQKLGSALFKVLRKLNAMVVISTDLSHFYQQKTANLLDANILEEITKMDPHAIVQCEADGTGFACGAGAVIAGIQYARLMGVERGILLNYSTSGDVTGDYSSVVGYGAVAYTKEK